MSAAKPLGRDLRESHYVHPSSAPDLKADADQHLDDVEVARIEASNR